MRNRLPDGNHRLDVLSTVSTERDDIKLRRPHRQEVPQVVCGHIRVIATKHHPGHIGKLTERSVKATARTVPAYQVDDGLFANFPGGFLLNGARPEDLFAQRTKDTGSKAPLRLSVISDACLVRPHAGTRSARQDEAKDCRFGWISCRAQGSTFANDTTMLLETGVWLPSAKLSTGTRTFVSGK